MSTPAYAGVDIYNKFSVTRLEGFMAIEVGLHIHIAPVPSR